MDNQLTNVAGQKELKEEIERLRTEISMMYLERDDLLLHQCKAIETEYLLSLGPLEYNVYEAECQFRRLKRKLELIISKRNRGEKVIPAEIDLILDSIFEDYQLEINKKIEAMNKALKHSKGEMLSNNEIAKIKKLYRTVVKALHPDLHPDLPAAKVQLFITAMDSYENGDLKSLETICEIIGSDTFDSNNNTLRSIKEESVRLKEILQSIIDSIAKIKESYPYVLINILNDEEAIKKKKAELNNELAFYKAESEKYKGELEKYV